MITITSKNTEIKFYQIIDGNVFLSTDEFKLYIGIMNDKHTNYHNYHKTTIFVSTLNLVGDDQGVNLFERQPEEDELFHLPF